MTLRNPNRAPSSHHDSWRQDIISYRRGRVERSLTRLRTHPAVNPSGPHGPHGRVTASPSTMSSRATYPASCSTTSNPAQTHSPNLSGPVPPGIIPGLFNMLVLRDLGCHPSNNQSTNSAGLTQYLNAARAVSSAPTLSDPHFVTRLATGNEPTRLADRKLLASIHSKPTNITRQSQSTRAIHLAIQKASFKRAQVQVKMKKSRSSKISPYLRRSTRKRLRSETSPATSSENQANQTVDISDPDVSDLEAFRPTPESVRITRTAAARSRRSSKTNTPSECCFCPDPKRFEGEEIQSELIGPFVDRRGNAKLFVHFDCSCWAPQVYADPANGQLRRVYDEYCRGRKLKCSSCGEKGATIGCYVQRCKKVFHYRCLEPAKAYCVERFFAAYCETHSHRGKTPSYKILMEAATIADVSAAQRREDTTYGLDAPHSRYTLLRRRETEIIFSRKWRICSHRGAFDTGRVLFSHRRKLILGKRDCLRVGDRVRVLRSSALDIATGRLAFMALAQKDEASGDVTAVEARAAMASRESTGLLLLRNLRRARQWEAGEIEVVRSISIGSKTSQASPTGRPDQDRDCGKQSQEHEIVHGKDQFPILSGKKRHGLRESTETNIDPERKRLKLAVEKGNCEVAKSSTAESSSITTPSAPLPSFDKKTRKDVSEADIERKRANSLTQTVSDKDTLRDAPESVSRPLQRKHDNRLLLRDSNSYPPSSSQDPAAKSQQLTRDMDSSIAPVDLGVPNPMCNLGSKKREAENPEGERKVKSAWKTFLEEQLPRERLLRPDDAMADSLRNMARLWSLMTPTQRTAYEKRGQECSFAVTHPGSSANSAAPPKKTSTGNAGLFLRSQRSHTQSESAMKSRLKMKQPGAKRQRSLSLSGMKEARRECGSEPSQGEDLNWDNLFPTILESNPSRRGVRGSSNGDGRQVPIDRVRVPPTRTKAGS